MRIRKATKGGALGWPPDCSEVPMMTSPRTTLLAITVGYLTVVAGCGDSLQTDHGPFKTTVVTHAAERKFDLLFIVDDSSAFAPYAETAAAGFAQLANVLENLLGGRPSIHAAFVPASTSTAGCASPPPRASDCALATSDAFAMVDGCGASPNFPGTLGETFTCLGSFESRDCAALTPLAAMREALGGGGVESPLTGRAPFLRSDAELALVVFASGDDASARDGAPIPVQEYVDFVRSLKPEPATPVAVSIIAPPPLTTIPRLTDFVQAFGGDGLVYSLTVGANIGPAFRRWPSASQFCSRPLARVAFGTAILSCRACNPNVRQRIGDRRRRQRPARRRSAAAEL